MMDWQYRFYSNPPAFLKPLIPFILLDIVLRGFALWRAARKGQSWWFIALIIVNSLGILPGIYLLTNSESKKSPKKR